MRSAPPPEMTLDFASVLPDASRDCSDTKSGDSHKRAPASTLKLLFTPTERAREKKKPRGRFWLWHGAGLANGTARQYKNHASETTQGLFYYWFVHRRAAEATYVPRAVYNWQVPADRHDVRSLDGARLAHFTHCGKPPSKINGRYDACAILHREWRETWARVAAESGVVA